MKLLEHLKLLLKHLKKINMNSNKTGKGGFLIDTNIWAYLFNPKKYPEQYANIQTRLKRIWPKGSYGPGENGMKRNIRKPFSS